MAGAGQRAGRLIEGEACLVEGIAWLSAVEPRFAEAAARTGLPPLRRVPDGFGALADIVMGQMVSIASARAIVARLEAAGLREATAVAAAPDSALTACGLSRQKLRTLKALAEARIDFAALRDLPDAEVAARLTALPGIGPWSAQLYLLTALGRADAFAPGDLAKQEAARALFGLQARPDARSLAAMAEAWSPWRGVAARLLWSYYRGMTGREGMA